MCLGVPGKIIETYKENGFQMAKVDFGGVIQDVCIETVPEAEVGNYVIVHAGFALNMLDEKEAMETLDLLRQVITFEEEYPDDDDSFKQSTS